MMGWIKKLMWLAPKGSKNGGKSLHIFFSLGGIS